MSSATIATVGARAEKVVHPQGLPLRAILMRVLLYAFALLAVGITLFPILWMVKVALSQQVDALQMPPVWITNYTLENFRRAWGGKDFVRSLGNSLIVAGLTSVISIGVALFAAYAFSRFRFKGSQALLLAVLSTRIFPPATLAVPFFLNFRVLGLSDTHIGLALAYIAMDIPLAVWMLKGYYDAIPAELEEAAMIDGASRFEAVRRVVLPLLGPGLAATTIFVFITSWNEFLFALILTSRNARTLPVTVAEYIGDTGIDWPEVMAAGTIMLAPVLILTYALQKHLANGLTGGAVKG